MTEDAVEPVSVVPVREGPRKHKRLALRLRTARANDLAKTLNSLFREEMKAESAGAARSVVVVPEPFGNSLLISGPPDAVDDVCRLVQELDRPKTLVLFEVVITRGAADEVKPDPTETLIRARLVTADCEPATLFFGSEVLMTSDVEVHVPGQHQALLATRLTTRLTGTSLRVTPRILQNSMAVFDFCAEDSPSFRLQSRTVAISAVKDIAIRQKPLESLLAVSTLCLRDGETGVLWCQRPPAHGGERILILVTPHVIKSFTNL